MKIFVSATSAIALLSGVSARTFTVVNSCSFTVWPAIFTDPAVSSSVPNFPTGWEAASGTKVNFTVPDNWKAGRIWGRKGCNFSTSTGPASCLTGGCNGGLLCDAHSGTPVPPVTVAEFTLGASANQDYYDVSVTDGFNLPMRITNNKGCTIADCPVDLVPDCPAPLKAFDASGNAIGCKSACEANLDGTPANSANCCTGSHITPATCPPSGVQYYSYFKSRCPNSYVFVYDNSGNTPLNLPCSSADYTVTFCPQI